MDTNLTLSQIRNGIGVTQQQMADAMGMPLRSYQDIEAGKNPVRPIHLQAAAFAMVTMLAQGKVEWDRLPWHVQEAVRGGAEKIPRR